jgi:hypothetical protein
VVPSEHFTCMNCTPALGKDPSRLRLKIDASVEIKLSERFDTSHRQRPCFAGLDIRLTGLVQRLRVPGCRLRSWVAIFGKLWEISIMRQPQHIHRSASDARGVLSAFPNLGRNRKLTIQPTSFLSLTYTASFGRGDCVHFAAAGFKRKR